MFFSRAVEMSLLASKKKIIKKKKNPPVTLKSLRYNGNYDVDFWCRTLTAVLLPWETRRRSV